MRHSDIQRLKKKTRNALFQKLQQRIAEIPSCVVSATSIFPCITNELFAIERAETNKSTSTSQNKLLNKTII